MTSTDVPAQEETVARTPGGVARGVLRTMRPRQWVKNVLVFAAPGAAGVLDQWDDLWRTLLTFVAFCLGASAIYLWNDALDVESDRIHPTKRFRPIAAGIVPVRTAKVVGTVLPVLALVVAAGTGHWETVVVIAVYDTGLRLVIRAENSAEGWKVAKVAPAE